MREVRLLDTEQFETAVSTVDRPLLGDQNEPPGLTFRSCTVRPYSEFTRLKPSGHYMYHQFNIHKSFVLPTQLYLCVLCGSQNKQQLFPYTALTDWFV
jgi:hypothetical protein